MIKAVSTVLNYGLSPARVQGMGRGILRSLGFTAATFQSRLTAFHTCPISDVIVGMTKFKLSSGSSSAAEWWSGQQYFLWLITRHGQSS